MCFNAHYEELAFTLPAVAFGRRWHRAIDTADPDLLKPVGPVEAGAALPVEGRAVVVLQLAETSSADGIALADT